MFIIVVSRQKVRSFANWHSTPHHKIYLRPMIASCCCNSSSGGHKCAIRLIAVVIDFSKKHKCHLHGGMEYYCISRCSHDPNNSSSKEQELRKEFRAIHLKVDEASRSGIKWWTDWHPSNHKKRFSSTYFIFASPLRWLLKFKEDLIYFLRFCLSFSVLSSRLGFKEEVTGDDAAMHSTRQTFYIKACKPVQVQDWLSVCMF